MTNSKGSGSAGDAARASMIGAANPWSLGRGGSRSGGGCCRLVRWRISPTGPAPATPVAAVSGSPAATSWSTPWAGRSPSRAPSASAPPSPSAFPPGTEAAVARLDQARLVGGDHRLHTAAQAELGQDAAHVGLHRGLAEVQLGGQLGVGPPGGEAHEDLALAVGEAPSRDGVGHGGPAGPAGSTLELDVALDDPPGDRRGQEAFVAGDGVDGLDQRVGGRVF